MFSHSSKNDPNLNHFQTANEIKFNDYTFDISKKPFIISQSQLKNISKQQKEGLNYAHTNARHNVNYKSRLISMSGPRKKNSGLSSHGSRPSDGIERVENNFKSSTKSLHRTLNQHEERLKERGVNNDTPAVGKYHQEHKTSRSHDKLINNRIRNINSSKGNKHRHKQKVPISNFFSISPSHSLLRGTEYFVLKYIVTIILIILFSI